MPTGSITCVLVSPLPVSGIPADQWSQLNSHRHSAGAGQPSEAAPADAVQATPEPVVEETVYYEGSGAPGELVVSLLLGATLLYL